MKDRLMESVYSADSVIPVRLAGWPPKEWCFPKPEPGKLPPALHVLWVWEGGNFVAFFYHPNKEAVQLEAATWERLGATCVIAEYKLAGEATE
jgi:hypothetical protein